MRACCDRVLTGPDQELLAFIEQAKCDFLPSGSVSDTVQSEIPQIAQVFGEVGKLADFLFCPRRLW